MQQEPSSHNFSFGFVIFSLFFMIPLLLIGLFSYKEYNKHKIEIKCIEQNRTYVNSVCFDIPLSLLKLK